MTIATLAGRRTLTVLGLNSGTSADALDLATIRITTGSKGPLVTFISGKACRFPSLMRARIIELADDPNARLNDIMYLDNALGAFFAKQAATEIKRLRADGITVNLIGSHGQTVRHLPEPVAYLGKKHRATLQVGSSEFIAAATGKPVVSDFRQGDIALGNEGAPITAGAVYELLASPSQYRIVVNIGGMSNFFLLPPRRSSETVRAEDCGPGNSIIDAVCRLLLQKSFDRNGRSASRGNLSVDVLSKLEHKLNTKAQTKSTGRERYGTQAARTLVEMGRSAGLSNHDILCVATEYTAVTLSRKLRPILKRCPAHTKLYLTGGGRNNIFLRERIAHHIPGTMIGLVDELGISGDYLEAASYALMGEACLRTRVLAGSKWYRGSVKPIPGKIAQPPIRRLKK